MKIKKLVFIPDGFGGYIFAGTFAGRPARKQGEAAMITVFLGEERIVPAKGAKIVGDPDELK